MSGLARAVWRYWLARHRVRRHARTTQAGPQRQLLGTAQLDQGHTTWTEDEDGWHPAVTRERALRWRRGT